MKIRLWAVSLAALGILAFGTPRPLQAQQRQRVTADVAPPLSASRDVKADEEPGVPKGETYADMVAPDAAPGRFPDKAPAGAGQPIASSPASIDSKPAEDTGVKFKFKPGDNNLLQMESNSGLFKFYAGGRLQVDAVWLTTKDNVQAPRDKGGIGNVQDAVNFINEHKK